MLLQRCIAKVHEPYQIHLSYHVMSLTSTGRQKDCSGFTASAGRSMFTILQISQMPASELCRAVEVLQTDHSFTSALRPCMIYTPLVGIICLRQEIRHPAAAAAVLRPAVHIAIPAARRCPEPAGHAPHNALQQHSL